MIRGTTGYAEQAAELIARYEVQPFEHKHVVVVHLLPAAPSRVVDIGARTGADAAWLARCGHHVVAVEPTEALRSYGMAEHASPRIEWLDDSLPELARLVPRQACFDLVMLTAVWMHLDQAERAAAMPRLTALLAPGGVMVMAIRHGPVPAGRVMFEVSSAETIALAQSCGLRAVLDVRTASTQPANRDAGVTWARLAFVPAGTA